MVFMKKLSELRPYQQFRFAKSNRIYTMNYIRNHNAHIYCRGHNAVINSDVMVYPLSLMRVALSELKVDSLFYMDNTNLCRLVSKPDIPFGLYHISVDGIGLEVDNIEVYVAKPKNIVFGGYYSYEDALVYGCYVPILRKNGFQLKYSKLEMFEKDGINYVVQNFSYQVGPIWLVEED